MCLLMPCIWQCCFKVAFLLSEPTSSGARFRGKFENSSVQVCFSAASSFCSRLFHVVRCLFLELRRRNVTNHFKSHFLVWGVPTATAPLTDKQSSATCRLSLTFLPLKYMAVCTAHIKRQRTQKDTLSVAFQPFNCDLFLRRPHTLHRLQFNAFGGFKEY